MRLLPPARLFSLAAILLLVWSGTACGGDDAPDTSPRGVSQTTSQSSSNKGDQATGDLKDAVEAAFTLYANAEGIPFRDVQYNTISNDNTFASVQVIAWFRPSAQSDWQEKEAQIEARKVGEQWRVEPDFAFSPTAAERAKQGQIATATAAVEQATANAQATIYQQAANATAAAYGTAQAEYDATQAAVATGTAARILAAKCLQLPSSPTTIDIIGYNDKVVYDTDIQSPGRITVPGYEYSGRPGDARIHLVRIHTQAGQVLKISIAPMPPAWIVTLAYPSGEKIIGSVHSSHDEFEQLQHVKIECTGMYYLFVYGVQDLPQYTITVDVMDS